MIGHLDLDAFYAAVEQLDHPELRGRPLVVGGDPNGRGVVSTASYEARRYGIRSAMSCAEARRRCATAIFVRPDFERYGARSKEVWEVVASLVSRVEKLGMDEGYLDLDGDAAACRAQARRVQEAVREATSLGCSIGVGTSKTVAKIASDREKPGGLVVVAPGEEAAFLGPLPIRLLPGVGPRGEARLQAAGVKTIGDLAALGDDALPLLAAGRTGRELRRRARGDDPRTVDPEPAEPVSIGYEETFDRDLPPTPPPDGEMRRMAAEVAARLARRRLSARTVTAKVRYHDFALVTRSRTGSGPVSEAELADLAVLLCRRALDDRAEPVRLLGVYASKLAAVPAAEAAQQLRIPLG